MDSPLDTQKASLERSAPTVCRLSAHEMARRVREGEIGARDLLDEHLRHIAESNEDTNALVTLNAKQARYVADGIDDRKDRGEQLGRLAGVPVAIHDLQPTRNMRTTYGSRVYKNYVPRNEAVLVSRLREADAILIGKSATTEFGIGAKAGHQNTPAPRNAIDPAYVAGGSSGGSAAAVASFMVAFADGSDVGGSARTAASFNGIAALRPTPGRVPNWPSDFAWETLSSCGLLARSITDVALAFQVIAGSDERSPLSTRQLPAFPISSQQPVSGRRVAWTPDFDRYAVAPEILDLCTKRIEHLESLGVEVVESTPPLDNIDEVFHILRAWQFALSHQSDLHHHRDEMSAVVRDNIEEGLKLNGLVMARAETLRTRIFHKMREFFEDFDFLLTPSSQVLPYTPDQLGKLAHETATSSFFGGMPICYPASLAGLPSVSVPIGSSPNGLPAGLQIVAPFGRDEDLLGFATSAEVSNSPGVA